MEKRGIIIGLIIVSMGLLFFLNQTGLVVKDQPREITIFAEKWEFVPNEIRVKYNEPIRLKLATSEKNESFSFKLSRYMYNDLIVINGNETSIFDFRAHTKGVFSYRCENPCGYGKNLMVGRLIVE